MIDINGITIQHDDIVKIPDTHLTGSAAWSGYFSACRFGRVEDMLEGDEMVLVRMAAVTNDNHIRNGVPFGYTTYVQNDELTIQERISG